MQMRLSMPLSKHAALPIVAHAASRSFAFKRGYLTYATDIDDRTDFFWIQGTQIAPHFCSVISRQLLLEIFEPGASVSISYKHFDHNKWLETHGTVVLTGAFDIHDLADLLTYLTQRGMSFIPSQIGMPLLQNKTDADFEFIPEHAATIVSAFDEKDREYSTFLAWDAVRPFLRHVLEHGYDEDAAQKAYTDHT